MKIVDLEELGEKYEEFITTLSNSLKAINGHGLDRHNGLLYHLDKAVRMAIFSAPFKKNDRIELIEDLKIDEDSGWYCHKHDLCKGKHGVVSSIEIWERSEDQTPYYVVYFKPDNQTYVCSFGEDKGRHFPRDKGYVYPIPAEKFRKVD